MLKKTGFLCAMLLAITALRMRSASAVLSAQFGPPRRAESQQEREMEDRRQKELNKQRQDDIRKDTEKLFQLATELKEAVDKTNEHVLSLDVVKKAEEVEKLAKRVKEKMRDSVGRPVIGEPPPGPRPPLGPP